MDKGTCSVAVCERPQRAKGMCEAHWQWYHKHGSVPTHPIRVGKRTRTEALATARAWKARNRERVQAYMREYHATRSSGRPTGRPATHGMTKTREFRSWEHAKARVLNPNHHAWADYGGRGITMCPEWVDDFAAFYAYMGPRPPDTSLDRIDPNGNYEPGNVRWADRKTQGANRRNVANPR